MAGVDMSLFEHEKKRSGHEFLLRQARAFQERISQLEHEWTQHKTILDDEKYADEGDDETVMDESIAKATSLLAHARFQRSKLQSEYQVSRQRLKECSVAIKSVERVLGIDGGDGVDPAATTIDQGPQDQDDTEQSAEEQDASRRTLLERLDRCAELVYTIESGRHHDT